MAIRTLCLMCALLWSGMSVQQAAASEIGLFDDTNSSDYSDYGVAYFGDNLLGRSNWGLHAGFSVEVPRVSNNQYLTSYGLLRASLFPRALIEPYASLGIDLLELGVAIFSDGNITPTIDAQLNAGVRFNLGDTALDAYYKTAHLTGLSIADGTYRSLGLTVVYRF